MSPNTFDWREASGQFAGIYSPDVPSLVFRPYPEDYWFTFAPGVSRHSYESNPLQWMDHHWRGEHCIQYSPGPESKVHEEILVPWADVQFAFRSWINQVRDETRSPDLWAGSDAEKVIEAVETSNDNRPFTVAESQIIQNRLADVLHEVRVRGVLQDAQFRVLRDRLDDQARASSRLGRKDWMNSFIGVVLSWLWTVATGSPAGHDIAQLIIAAAGGWMSSIKKLSSE